MSTIDIGKIKIVWKGAWDSSTAYTVDDAVSHSGNSYICIQAGSNQNPSSATAYWQIMASAGTNGTDADLLNIASTAQGDIYYNNGSAIARLAPGIANQVLQTGGASANPSWGTVSSDFVKVAHTELGSNAQNITMSNVFTTTYDIYVMYFQYARDTQSQIYMEFEKASDSAFLNSGYYFTSSMATRNASTTSVDQQGDWNYSSFRAHENQVSTSTHDALWHFKFVRPAEARQTRYQYHISQYDGSYARELAGGGWNSNSVAVSGLRLATTSGLMLAGSSVSIYGIKHA